MTRKLASIKPITHIKPIPEADAIECAIVDGVVFKSLTSDFTFKAISNSYLLKHKDR
jgi:hypothetical protein